MPLINSDNKTHLIDISFATGTFIAASFPGEEFHKKYKSQKEPFAKLIKSDMSLEKSMKSYFRKLFARIDKKVNWQEYQSQMKKASVSDLVDADWDEETLFLKVILTNALKDAISAGAQFTEEEFNFSSIFSENESEALIFLRKYTLKLANDLTNTTQDRIKKALLQSIQLGENKEDAVRRLSPIIQDPRRAATIAHTESVRAFSFGRLEVGKEMGATKKEWSTTFNACPICVPLNNKQVGIESTFPGGYDAPPAHPNCRCLLELVLE